MGTVMAWRVAVMASHAIGVFIPFGGLFVAIHQIAYIMTIRHDKRKGKQ